MFMLLLFWKRQINSKKQKFLFKNWTKENVFSLTPPIFFVFFDWFKSSKTIDTLWSAFSISTPPPVLYSQLIDSNILSNLVLFEELILSQWHRPNQNMFIPAAFAKWDIRIYIILWATILWLIAVAIYLKSQVKNNYSNVYLVIQSNWIDYSL